MFRAEYEHPSTLQRRNLKTQVSLNYCDVIVFKKLSFQFVFRPHENEKTVFSNSSGLKSVFEKLSFQLVFRPHENEKTVFSISSRLKSVFKKLRFQGGLM